MKTHVLRLRFVPCQTISGGDIVSGSGTPNDKALSVAQTSFQQRERNARQREQVSVVLVRIISDHASIE